VNAKGLSGIMSSAITQLYEDAEAGQYGMDVAAFTDVVGAILQKAAADRSDAEQITLLRTLHLKELVLARACATVNDAAWDEFMKRFRPALYATAVRLTQNDAAGQELAASLWADLYGLPNREGRRVSRLESYTGRGSLEGWLRGVLAQEHVNRFRREQRHSRDAHTRPEMMQFQPDQRCSRRRQLPLHGSSRRRLWGCQVLSWYSFVFSE